MSETHITSTEFQSKPGLYLDAAASAPVFITKHKRLARVLVSVDEYERLKARDTRQSYKVEETVPKMGRSA